MLNGNKVPPNNQQLMQQEWKNISRTSNPINIRRHFVCFSNLFCAVGEISSSKLNPYISSAVELRIGPRKAHLLASSWKIKSCPKIYINGFRIETSRTPGHKVNKLDKLFHKDSHLFICSFSDPPFHTDFYGQLVIEAVASANSGVRQGITEQGLLLQNCAVYGFLMRIASLWFLGWFASCWLISVHVWIFNKNLPVLHQWTSTFQYPLSTEKLKFSEISRRNYKKNDT